MLQSIKFALFISILIIIYGCSSRKDFIRPSQDTFKLGTTSYPMVVQKLGEPKYEGSMLKNEKTIKAIAYSYSSVINDDLGLNAIPARTMSYLFFDDILVGEEFISSFKSDSSYFEDGKINELFKDKTTRSEVIKLFGRPSCYYIYPMNKDIHGESIGYIYGVSTKEPFNEIKHFNKTLIISFSDKDIVSDVSFTSIGSSPYIENTVSTNKDQKKSVVKEIESISPVQYANDNINIPEQLKKLKQLKDSGFLTNSEYESKRKILADKL